MVTGTQVPSPLWLCRPQHTASTYGQEDNSKPCHHDHILANKTGEGVGPPFPSLPFTHIHKWHTSLAPVPQGQNLVVWSHLTAEEVGNITFLWVAVC